MIFFWSRPSALAISWLCRLSPGDRLNLIYSWKSVLLGNSRWLWSLILPDSCFIYSLFSLYFCILSHDLFYSSRLHNDRYFFFFSDLICTREWGSLLSVKQSHFRMWSLVPPLLQRPSREEQLCLLYPALWVPLYISQPSPLGAKWEDKVMV